MKKFEINLAELVKPPYTDSISGREFGEAQAETKKLMEHIQNGEKVVIIIDSNVIKAINDSFIKGFFSNVFENLHKKETVKEHFELISDEYYKRLFDKNWTLLEAINNA